jgi:hypothetical protein
MSDGFVVDVSINWFEQFRYATDDGNLMWL